MPGLLSFVIVLICVKKKEVDIVKIQCFSMHVSVYEDKVFKMINQHSGSF